MSSGRTPAKPPVTPAQMLAEEPVYLVALRPVQVNSVKAVADKRELVPPRALVTGERYALPNLDMLIDVSAREAVQLEFKGARYGAGSFTGAGVLAINFSVPPR
jgi:hypothetical protein